jgi:hypothetical protein
MNLKLERGLGDERKALIRVKAGSLYKKTPLGRIFFLIPYFL